MICWLSVIAKEFGIPNDCGNLAQDCFGVPRNDREGWTAEKITFFSLPLCQRGIWIINPKTNPKAQPWGLLRLSLGEKIKQI